MLRTHHVDFEYADRTVEVLTRLRADFPARRTVTVARAASATVSSNPPLIPHVPVLEVPASTTHLLWSVISPQNADDTHSVTWV